jgi:hypothetical protein
MAALPGPAEQILADPGLTGAVIIVTGAGSGTGAAAPRQLGAAGARVVLVGRRPDPLDEVAGKIRSAGGDAWCLPADLADPESPGRVAAACLDHYGHIDGLVNNAAVVRHKPLGEWDVAGFDEHVATNVRAPFFLIPAALPALRESVRAVVNIGSSSGTLQVGQSVRDDQVGARLPDPHPGWRAGSARRARERHRTRPIDTPIDLGGGPGRGLPLARRPKPLALVTGEVALWILLLLSPAASFLTGR